MEDNFKPEEKIDVGHCTTAGALTCSVTFPAVATIDSAVANSEREFVTIKTISGDMVIFEGSEPDEIIHYVIYGH